MRQHIIPCCHCSRTSAAPETRQQRTTAVHQILVDVAQQMRQFGRIHATDRHRVAVPPAEVFELSMAWPSDVGVEVFTQSGFFEVG